MTAFHLLVAGVPGLLLALRGPTALEWLAGRHGPAPAVAAWSALVWIPLWWGWFRAWFLPRISPRLPRRAARWGLGVVIALHATAFMAPLLSTHDPLALGHPTEDRYRPPSAEHWMGTDLLGRDLYSRVVHGTRTSLAIATASLVLSLGLGVLVGGVAGYARGWGGAALMRFTDLMMAFPRLFLLLALVALFTPSFWLIVGGLGAVGWMSAARLVHGETLRIANLEYVEGARALGVPSSRILLRHVLPAALSPLIAFSALRVGNTILTESFLSYLGLGVGDPAVSWGLLIRSGRDSVLSHWWVSTFPGLAILVTGVAYNLLGDGLRDLYDPRLGREALHR